MSVIPTTPSLEDLSRLAKQIEKDRSVPVRELRQRDHAIGLKCHANDNVSRLLFWLNNQPNGNKTRIDTEGRSYTEVTAAHMLRILALCLGFMAMSGFLLSEVKGDVTYVNVNYFFLLFVLIHVIFCVISAYVMTLLWLGSPPVVFPLNITKLILKKSLPDIRHIQESNSVIRALLLRYGQEFGAIFTIGSLVAFFIVQGHKDLNFYWEMTYEDPHLESITSILATPWSSWYQDGLPSAEVIQGSRSRPSSNNIKVNNENHHGWWPFLIMAMLFYAFLPRVVLWVVSKRMYSQLMRRSFANYPGSEGALLRMSSPLVSTQSYESEELDDVFDATISLDDSLLLLSWAGAVDIQDIRKYEEIRIVPQGNVLSAGLDTLEGDRQCIVRINEYKPSRILLAVKSWEPPMAELREFLESLTEVKACTVCLVPLPGHTVTELQLQEWRDFSRKLRFDVVDTQPLTRL